MKRTMNLVLALVLLAICFAFGARAEALEDYCGTWAADGAAVEIWTEDGEGQCRAVFVDDSGEAEIWQYGSCCRDESAPGLQCLSVTRTRERLDPLFDSLEELSWSMNDFATASLELSNGSLLFTDETMDAPIALTRLDDAPASERTRALAYLGKWSGEAGELWVEDHGVCCQFTVTVPVDEVTRHRWTYTCVYDAESGAMETRSISPLGIITLEADGTSEVEEYNDAELATFTLRDGGMIWSALDVGEAVLERATE